MFSRFLPLGLALCSLLVAFYPVSGQQAAPPVPEPRQQAPAKQIPPELTPWIGWATWDDAHRDCPTPYSDAAKHLCFWPSRLNLQVDKTGAAFDLGVTVYHETWVPLPGNADVWPMEVMAGGAQVPVVEHGDRPAVQLPAGTHELRGVFRWAEAPIRLKLPQEIGLLSLTLDGAPVVSPSRDAEGQLWLKRDAASEQVERDFLSVKMYAMLEDGIPLWWRSEVELTVSGRSREEQIGNLLPEGWRLASVTSEIPVAVDDAGNMKAQVRAGKWTIRADAFRIDNPKELKFAAGSKPATPEVLLGFRAQPELRMIEIAGAVPVDVSQTTFPQHWKNVPVYRWETGSPVQIVERMRGMGEQKPAGLTIGRELWLDENGSRITAFDRIEGSNQQVWRLDAAKGQELGSVRSRGEGLLITRNPATGASGVELREREIFLDATGRLARSATFSATGWQADADSVKVALNLPPGWRLFALFGADWVEGDWLTAWTLLDLFLLLIFTLAVAKLWGIAAGALAFAAFGLTYHEPGAPAIAWLVLLIPLALSRVVPSGWASRLLTTAKWIVILVLLLILVPFIGGQIQQAIYPQLEPTYDAHTISSAAVSARTKTAPDFASFDGEMPASPSRYSSGRAEIQQRLESTKIPVLSFREASIRDAISYLQNYTGGVPIVLDEHLQGAGEARITVELKDVPLNEALRYVTGLANLKFVVEADRILIRPYVTATDVLITKEFSVSPEVLAGPSGGSSRRYSAKEALEASGVSFPPGAVATYLPESNKLIVRNTQENLDLIDGLMVASAEPVRAQQKDLTARIQTGPGIPAWSWRTVNFGWNGPVTASQEVRPILIPAWLTRVLSVLRVVLVLALAGVLLKGRVGLRRSAPPAPGAAAALIAILLALASGNVAAGAEIPDAETLKQLRERVMQKSDAFPRAAEIPSASLTLREGKLTLEAEVHVAAESALPLPAQLPSISPVSVTVDDKPAAALRREDGFLWVVLPEGVHRVRMEGVLANVSDWEWTYRLKPRSVRVDAPDWDVSGVGPNGVPGPQVLFSRKQAQTPGAAAYELQNLQSLASVQRTLDLGLVWHVRTTVGRLSQKGRAMVLRIPLLPGERVLDSNALVRDGAMEVRLGAQDDAFVWESRLEITDELTLSTRPQDTWVESWRLIVAPVWNVTPSGLPPIFPASDTSLSPTWQPWPGESVKLAITRPEPVPGATVAIDRATHTVSLGSRQRTSKLELSLRCTVGEDFLVELPGEAEITSLFIDGKPNPVRKDGTRVVVPVRPGEQKVTLEWKTAASLGFATRGEQVRLPVESANIDTIYQVPDNRWVLWTQGPLRGPAVRFWGVLAMALLAAWALGRLRLSPLRTYEWILLGVGLTQVPLPVAMIVVAWLFLLAWRGGPAFQQLPPIPYNLLQVLLIGLTAGALGIFVAVVAAGLLGNPKMFIQGNGSTPDLLRWYQASSDGVLPEPLVVSVSIWWYRFLMLLWALWLAASLIRWLRVGWTNFSSGGFFRRKPAAPVAPPPLRSASHEGHKGHEGGV